MCECASAIFFNQKNFNFSTWRDNQEPFDPEEMCAEPSSAEAH